MSQEMTKKNRLDYAKFMAAKGIAIFMVQPGSKRPLEGHSWYLRQSTEPETIEQLFAATPDANFGAHLGENYVVIDLDNKPGANGVVAFEEICAKHDVESFLWDLDTFTVKTPGGGYHLYFKAPFACANKNHFPDGIDVRGVSGYVVGPGSKDSRGEWKVLDEDAETKPLPDWLVEYIVEPGYKDPNYDIPLIDLDQEESIQHATEWLQDREPAEEGKNGDDWTYETLQYLRDFGLSETKAAEVINSSGWNARCEPPWGDAELEAKITNAYSYGQNRPGCKSPVYKAKQFMMARPEGGWGAYLTEERINEMFHPTRGNLALVVDNDPEIPSDEPDADELFPAYLVGELDSIPDPAWLIRDVLPEISLGMTYGSTGSLKTFLELDKALWGAVGEPWAASEAHDLDGFKVARKLRTVIIAGEGARGLKRRIAAWAKRHEIETNDLPVLVIPVMPRFANDGDLRKLARTVEAKLPNPDHVVVDTAMWAAAGLNLNVPADSQVFLEGCKGVMLSLNCGLTFVHHTGKDKTRGHLGAENLIAGADVADCVELKEKGVGRRKIKIINKKMKDAELREMIFMEAYSESIGEDEDGRPISSLVLRRCHGSASVDDDGEDPRLKLALDIVAEYKGKMPLSMIALADEMARRYATGEMTDGQFAKAKEGMRNFLRKEATNGLAKYAHKAGKAKNAPWEFEDRTGRAR